MWPGLKFYLIFCESRHKWLNLNFADHFTMSKIELVFLKTTFTFDIFKIVKMGQMFVSLAFLISPFQKLSKFPSNIKISLKPGSLFGKNMSNFVYSLLILQNQSHAALHIYFSNHLPLSQQWIEIHFEVLLPSWTFIILFMTVEG